MARKDKKKGKGKVPKTIAGVKVPKAVRESLASTFLDNPQVRQILADMLIAAAGAAAAALVKYRPTGQQVADAGEAALDAGAGAAAATRDVVQSAAGTVTDAVADAARQILPASLTSGGVEDGKGESYAHLADDRKGKKEKQKAKASKH